MNFAQFNPLQNSDPGFPQGMGAAQGIQDQIGIKEKGSFHRQEYFLARYSARDTYRRKNLEKGYNSAGINKKS